MTYPLSMSQAVQVIFYKKISANWYIPSALKAKTCKSTVRCRFMCVHVIGGISNEGCEVELNRSLSKKPFKCISIWGRQFLD